MKRREIKEKELEFLAKEFQNYPQFFKRETFFDNAEFLEEFGFFIPEKENFPIGFIKFWPQDFIVEEVFQNGDIQTVDWGNFFHLQKSFFETEPTIYATLVKCQLSTIEAIEEINSFLTLSKIQFAGIKDKNALTSQLISLRKTTIEKLKEISSPYFFLKNVYSGKGVLEIGKLKGNNFTILIRTNNSFEKKKFLENLETLKKEGFYNFFYLQRFGTPRLINWLWGLLILKGQYDKAVFSFLTFPGKRETLYFKKKREEIRNFLPNWRKIERILEPLPLIFQNEIKIVRYLQKKPKDFIGALNQIPEQIQLWVFAYSSLLFNKKLSLILKESKDLPEKLPLILSRDKNDWLEYLEFLKEDEIPSFPLKNLKPFPFIQWKKREIKTKEKVKIHQIKIIPEGVILKFFLPKGAYATTFLAHLFNLVSGLPPQNISVAQIDLKAVLGEKPITKTLNKFKEIIHSRAENIFERFK